MLRRIIRWWFQPYVDAARLYLWATHEEDRKVIEAAREHVERTRAEGRRHEHE